MFKSRGNLAIRNGDVVDIKASHGTEKVPYTPYMRGGRIEAVVVEKEI